jgi:hypothetical protein
VRPAPLFHSPCIGKPLGSLLAPSTLRIPLAPARPPPPHPPTHPHTHTHTFPTPHTPLPYPVTPPDAHRLAAPSAAELGCAHDIVRIWAALQHGQVRAARRATAVPPACACLSSRPSALRPPSPCMILLAMRRACGHSGSGARRRCRLPLPGRRLEHRGTPPHCPACLPRSQSWQAERGHLPPQYYKGLQPVLQVGRGSGGAEGC